MRILKLIHATNKFLSSLKVIDSLAGSVFFSVKLIDSILYCHLFLGSAAMLEGRIPHDGCRLVGAHGAHAVGQAFVRVCRVEFCGALGHLRLVKTGCSRFIEISCSMVAHVLLSVYFGRPFSNILQLLCSFIATLLLWRNISLMIKGILSTVIVIPTSQTFCFINERINIVIGVLVILFVLEFFILCCSMAKSHVHFWYFCCWW